MDVIAQHAERWARIAFRLPLFCYERLERVSNRLPNFESLFLDNMIFYPLAAAEVGIFAIAPRLSAVQWGHNLHSPPAN
jgi:hypothetical protein